MIKRIIFLLFSPAAIICLICFFFFYLSPVQRQAITQELFANIPILKQFVVLDYNSKLFNTNIANVLELKTEVYYIDYLVDISQKTAEGTKRYIALYPFSVEAVVDLKQGESNKVGEESSVRYPSPELRAGVDNSREPLFLRDNLEHVDWKKSLKPIITALHEKAKIDAISSGIIDRACVRTQKQLQEWSAPGTKIVIQSENHSPLLRLQPPHLGIATYALYSNKINMFPSFSRFDAMFSSNSKVIGAVKFGFFRVFRG